MSNTVEIRREDWEKLTELHNTLSKLLFDTENFFFGLRQVGVNPAFSAELGVLHKRMKPISKFLFVEDEPFAIVPLKGGN